MITGHSLGGSMALIFSDLIARHLTENELANTYVYPIASPRPGLEDLALEIT